MRFKDALTKWSGCGLALSLSVSMGACSKDEGEDDGAQDGSEDGSGSAGEDADGDGGTSQGDEDGTEAGQDAGSGEADTGGESGGESGSEPQPDGAGCVADEDCISGHCFQAGALGGYCGECSSDADCAEGGCSIPNPLASPPTGSTCNMGEAGGGCMSDEVCQEGLQCTVVVEATGILTISTCGECQEDADCTEGTFCSPTVDISTVSGQRQCVEPMSVPNGQACDFDTTGDMACTSGRCKEVTVMGIITFGVCGDCEDDADCAEGETCSDPEIDIETGMVTPPACVPAR